MKNENIRTALAVSILAVYVAFLFAIWLIQQWW